MALGQKDKELAAIGASIGALCRPCIEHHIPAGRDAGLTEPELARAVEVAQAIHRHAAELLFRHSRELLHAPGTPAGVLSEAEPATRLDELVALGAGIGVEPFGWVINASLAAAGTRDPLLARRAAPEQPHIRRVTTELARRAWLAPWDPAAILDKQPPQVAAMS